MGASDGAGDGLGEGAGDGDGEGDEDDDEAGAGVFGASAGAGVGEVVVSAAGVGAGCSTEAVGADVGAGGDATQRPHASLHASRPLDVFGGFPFILHNLAFFLASISTRIAAQVTFFFLLTQDASSSKTHWGTQTPQAIGQASATPFFAQIFPRFFFLAIFAHVFLPFLNVSESSQP